MAASSIYEHPSVYDRIVPSCPCEAFYREIARQTGSPILELACGTGRLTILLAADGHEVFGLDCSAHMLRAARDKARALNVKPVFVLADMTSFHLERQFALIIVSCNSLAHLTSDEAISACLMRVAKHLAPGGLFVFDLANPNLAELGAAISQPRVTKSGDQGKEILAYDPVTQIQVVRFADATGGPLRRFWPICLRVIFPEEIVPRLWTAGLSLLKRYGDFDGNPLCSGSSNQVYIATGSASGFGHKLSGYDHAAT